MARTDGAPAFTKRVLLNQVRSGNYIKVEGRWSEVWSIRWDREYFHFRVYHPDYVHEEFSVVRGRKIEIMCWLKAQTWRERNES